MKFRHIAILFSLVFLDLPGGNTQIEPSYRVHERTVKNLNWRLLGPAHMSGRITDIAVSRENKYTIYCATATGGIWKTDNNGTTWNPIFDHEQTSSIGDIAVAESNPNIIWTGTGEANASSYTSWGNGVYKSTDEGKTWSHMGLSQTHHIGRVIIDPIDPNIVYVAALGHLWGSNPERGLFKTTDGGRTWKKSLYINEDVGFVDVIMDPTDNNTLYAASYGRRADRFDDYDSMGIHVIESGNIYKTKDGGENWEKLNSGLPSDRVGRIGLDIAKNSSNVIYAILERAPYQIYLESTEIDKIRQMLRSPQPEKNDVEELRRLIGKRTPPEEIPAVVVQGLGRRQQLQMHVLLGHGELDTGGGIFRSENKGETWRRVNNLNERASYYSQIRVDPKDKDHVYALLVRTWESTDGGRTFNQKGWAFSSFLTSRFIHGDFHALWIDPDNSSHLIIGSDGGLYISYDGGDNWEAHPMPLGQFVSVAVDMRKPYYVYGGLQDNGVWGGPSETRHVSGISDADWFKVITGDGGHVQVDPGDFNRIYAESQYGALRRINLKTGKPQSIRPLESGTGRQLRFNYVAPFIISSHDPNTIYLGAQCLLKSTENGNNWRAISPDLSKNESAPLTFEGSTITTISESPLTPGTLYVGTDDGNLYFTRDDGQVWTNLSTQISDLPMDSEGRPNIWVSRVETSHFFEGRAYVSFDGHRDDNFGVFVYATEDFGQSWSPIKSNLPEGFPINVIREDRKNENLLFVGTEIGVYFSPDRGRHWIKLKKGLPTVPVDDLLIHPRDADLVAGTHGRGIYVLDISPLQQLTQEVLSSNTFLFAPETATLFHVDITKNKGASGSRRFVAENPYSSLTQLNDRSGSAPPGATIYYYLKESLPVPVKISILDKSGEIVRNLTGPADLGINLVVWDLRETPLPLPPSLQRIGSNDSRHLAQQGPRTRPGPYIQAGQYRIRLLTEKGILERSLSVIEDN